MYGPSSELGLSHPLSCQRVCPFPRTKGGGAPSPAGEGVGKSQFQRLEKKLSTLPTLCCKLKHFFTILKEVYEKIFPLGDASKYAHLVFRAIDRERTGGITFGDFMEFLSIISKGTEEEKMMWSFQFYDVNQDGTISRDEMLKVSTKIIV